MFAGFMLNTWIAATMVAVAAGAVGFFVVLRNSAFAAHAIPHGAFGGAAGAVLLGENTLLGLGVFAVAGAMIIGWLGRRGRSDVAIALALVLMLGFGALFLSLSSEYAPAVYGLLFGETLGVASSQLLPTAVLGLVCLLGIGVFYRPLLLASALPEAGAARGVRLARMESAFLLIVALATTMTVPVVGALLVFSLMIGPAGTARSFTSAAHWALALSVALAVGTVWLAVALSYLTNWPVGFFVATLAAVSYGTGRVWSNVGAAN